MTNKIEIMDYEKKYKEALSRAKHALDCDRNNLVRTDLSLIYSMFPELKETDDERIRKTLIGWVNIEPQESFGDGFTKEEILAWLEKQGNKSDWNEEDELMLLSIIQSLELTNGASQIKIDWLKALKQRIGRRDLQVIHLPFSQTLPCYAPNGVCTNPHRDCINCPKTYGQNTIVNTLNKTDI